MKEGETTVVAHPQWIRILRTYLERAVKAEMGMGPADILWAKELLKSNNLRGNYSLGHIK